MKFNLFTVFKNAIDPFIGKTVVRFTTHGCMGQDQEFSYVGTIVGSKVSWQGYKEYILEAYKDEQHPREEHYVSAGQLIHKRGNIYVVFD